MTPNIFLFDIETAPKLAYVWRFFKENISPQQVKEHGHIMSFAGKWLDDENIVYADNRDLKDDRLLVEMLCHYLDEADMVVAHNGGGFDVPQIRGRALVYGLNPPSPVKVIDTWKIAKREFGFPSNSLAYLADVLGCEKKDDHKEFPGFSLWTECIMGNERAWEEMKKYNIQDVVTLEEVYLKLRPWDTKHPNLAIYEGELEEPMCPKCSSTSIQWRGYAYTNVARYNRFQCKDCGGWGRTRYRLNKKDENLLANVVS